MDFKQWYQETVSGRSVNAVAKALDMPHPTLTRHLRSADPNPATVVAIARRFGGDPISGLLASGLITHRDIERYESEIRIDALSEEDVDLLLSGLSNDVILSELKRRLPN